MAKTEEEKLIARGVKWLQANGWTRVPKKDGTPCRFDWVHDTLKPSPVISQRTGREVDRNRVVGLAGWSIRVADVIDGLVTVSGVSTRFAPPTDFDHPRKAVEWLSSNWGEKRVDSLHKLSLQMRMNAGILLSQVSDPPPPRRPGMIRL